MITPINYLIKQQRSIISNELDAWGFDLMFAETLL